MDYSVRLPDAMPIGRYDLKAKLFSRDANRDVFIAMDSKRQDSAGFYHLADVMVTKR